MPKFVLSLITFLVNITLMASAKFYKAGNYEPEELKTIIHHFLECAINDTWNKHTRLYRLRLGGDQNKTKIILSIFFCSSHCIFHCISFCKISSWAVKYKGKKFQSFKTQSYSGHRLQVVTHTLFSGSRLVKEAKFMNSVKIPTHVEWWPSLMWERERICALVVWIFQLYFQ